MASFPQIGSANGQSSDSATGGANARRLERAG